MANPVPHLHRNRLGTYYFRITVAGRTIKKSLRTKDVQLATMRAAQLNWELLRMPPSREPSVADILKAHQEGRTRRFDVELPSGVKLRGTNTAEDNARAMELIGKLPPEAFAAAPAAAPASAGALPLPTETKGMTFKVVAAKYIAELRKAGLEEEKGILEKESTYAAFCEEFGNPRIQGVTKDLVVAFKDIGLKTAGPGRVNKKTGHLSVLFEWAIGNGFAYDNPTLGTRIGKKASLDRMVEHYEPFAAQDIKKIFNPKTYPDYAWTKPHFHWIP